MKKLVILLIIALSLTACTHEQNEIIAKEKPVLVSKVELSENPIEMKYLGIVEPFEVKKYAFLTGGVLERLEVGVGDQVTDGDILAVLEKNKLSIAVDTAEEQSRTAQLAYSKAKESFNYYDKLLKDTKALLDSGATSKQTYDEVKLKRDIAYKELSQAGASAKQARLQKNYRVDNANDASLESDINGTVLDIMYKVGEVVPQGHPVVIMRSKLNAVKVGMTATDVKKIKKGDVATLILDDKKTLDAKVNRIHYVPDKGSRTYSVELTLADEGRLLLGESVDVVFELSKEKAVWLPISHILNDGQDYVYIVDNHRAKRTEVKILAVYQDKVAVEGLQKGDQLIISGTSTLSDGYKVTVVKPANDTSGKDKGDKDE